MSESLIRSANGNGSVPVAVKVLPDMAKEQAKWEFEMEALIMR